MTEKRDFCRLWTYHLKVDLQMLNVENSMKDADLKTNGKS